MTHTIAVPKGFEAVAHLGKWAADTTDERTALRQTSTKAELIDLYDTVLPHMEKILDACDAFPLGALPETHRGLYNIALSMAEIAPHVEFYKGDPQVPFSFDEERFTANHGGDPTWQALPPNGPR